MKTENNITAKSGFSYLVLAFVLLGAAIASFSLSGRMYPAIPVSVGMALTLAFILVTMGFFIVNPNQAKVLLFFGKYAGTVKENGFYWAHPFMVRKNLSMKVYNFMGDKLKVNDHVGNPIEIAAVVVWKVEDTFKANFGVDDYQNFVRVQSESALRSLAGKYPYDHFSDDHSETTLREGTEVVNSELEREIGERLSLAGIKVVEARISHLAYASEIAHAMLQRQQASAMVAARFKIVEGAVGMVEMALEQLRKREIVDLDSERKSAMVSNLLVVLCGERSVSPVVNAGTLHH